MELPKPDLAEVDTLIVEQIQQAEIRVKQKPSSASAWAMLGVVYWVNEFRDIGSQCLNQAVLLDPDQGRWVYYKLDLEVLSDIKNWMGNLIQSSSSKRSCE